MKYLRIVLLCLLLCLSMLWSCPFLVDATELTKSPSMTYAESGNWLDPTYAYSSNNQYAYSGITGDKQIYGDYGFSLSDSDEITKVELGLEGYITSGDVGVYISWDNASSWSFGMTPLLDYEEQLFWHDVTEDTEWTNTKLDDDHLKTRIYYQSTSGCYGLDAEVGLWEGGLKKVRDVKIGDVLTGWNEKEFVPATVWNTTLHKGKWEVLRIIAESVYRKGDFKDALVTPDHVLPYFATTIKPTSIVLSDMELKEKEAGNIEVGDYFYGFIEGSVDWETEKSIPTHMEPYRVYNVTKMVVEGVMDIQTDVKWFMGHYMLRIKIPWTGYVDWIPVRVTYTTEGAEEEEVDCNWIGTDNSVAGRETVLSADFTDLNQSDGLSHARIYHNNTGSFANSSWSAVWVRGNWTEWTITLNLTVGLVVAFRFFVNDSGGGEHQSTICFFTVEEPFVEFKVRGGAGTPIPYLTYVWNILRGALTTTEGRVTILVFGGVGFLFGLACFRRKREKRNLRVKRVKTS